MAAGPRPRIAGTLGEIKDAIGEWHDWQDLLEIARRTLDRGPNCYGQAELQRMVDRKYRIALAFTLKMQKKYLRNSTQVGILRAIAALSK